SAVAPRHAASGPAAYGGWGRRWASTRTRGDRNPLLSTVRPAADHPSRPHTATWSPGRAPERVTAARPWREPMAVTAATTTPEATTSPPATAAPTSWHSSRNPSANSTAHATGRSGGAPKQTTTAVGVAPMAATSARFWAAALRPTSYADDQSRRKWR